MDTKRKNGTVREVRVRKLNYKVLKLAYIALKTMKTYEIGVFEEQSGYVSVKAKTEKKARKIALERLKRNGINDFRSFDVQHRKVDIIY